MPTPHTPFKTWTSPPLVTMLVGSALLAGCSTPTPEQVSSHNEQHHAGTPPSHNTPRITSTTGSPDPTAQATRTTTSAGNDVLDGTSHKLKHPDAYDQLGALAAAGFAVGRPFAPQAFGEAVILNRSYTEQLPASTRATFLGYDDDTNQWVQISSLLNGTRTNITARTERAYALYTDIFLAPPPDHTKYLDALHRTSPPQHRPADRHRHATTAIAQHNQLFVSAPAPAVTVQPCPPDAPPWFTSFDPPPVTAIYTACLHTTNKITPQVVVTNTSPVALRVAPASKNVVDATPPQGLRATRQQDTLATALAPMEKTLQPKLLQELLAPGETRAFDLQPEFHPTPTDRALITVVAPSVPDAMFGAALAFLDAFPTHRQHTELTAQFAISLCAPTGQLIHDLTLAAAFTANCITDHLEFAQETLQNAGLSRATTHRQLERLRLYFSMAGPTLAAGMRYSYDNHLEPTTTLLVTSHISEPTATE